MKISIVATVFNEGKIHFEQCVNSLLQQTLRPDEYEIILVDDASTLDETVQAVAQYDRPGSRVRVVRHSENRGLNEARRTGVRAAEGDYVVFVDGDDMLTSDAVESLRMEALRTGADVVLSNMFRWNDANQSYDKMQIHGRPLPDDKVERLRSLFSGKTSFTMCGRLIRRSLLSDDVFDMPAHLLHEDVVSLPRIMFAARKVGAINRHVYYYRWSPGSITSQVNDRHISGILYAAEDWIRRARAQGLEEDLAPAIAEGLATLLNTLIQRAVYSSEGSPEACLPTLSSLWSGCRELDLPVALPPQMPAVRFLRQLFDTDTGTPGARLPQLIEEFGYGQRPALYDTEALLPEGLGPSNIAQRLKDRIVLICQVDYHFRNAAAFARQLALRGYSCVVVDNSGFAAGGKRPVTPEDRKLLWRTQYLKIDKPPYGSDWLSTASLVITFNDFNDDIHEALEYRRRLGQRTVCLIEGINDFLRVDFDEPRYLPYRRCDTVFLAGENDKRYFTDRETYVLGLPGIETLTGKQPEFPAAPLAVLNLNFTYGALERHRYAFLAAAQKAFDEIGWDWTITQHPMDGSVLPGLPVSKETQYELIDRCTVFVSRFATGILEALASGKPVIYFNPHGEKVEKYTDPMGAYEIATTPEELVAALKRVEADWAAGVDFRERALPFLAHHTGYAPSGPTAAERFADAVADIVETNPEPNRDVARLFFERLERRDAFQKYSPDLVFGDLDRRHYAQLEETDLVAGYFGRRGGVMLDVGANIGQSADTFLGKGWTVHAFEPDPKNLARLRELLPHHPRLHLNAEAVSDRAGEKVAFYGSDESAGVSSLVAFTAGHKLLCEVETVTLADYCREHGIGHVDFLKIDVEGHDKFVLDGFDWSSDRPEVISAEFEDAKTIQNGYSTHDLAGSLVDRGYAVYVSEWLPIERYGLAHDWRRLMRYAPSLDLKTCWGNLIAFRCDPGTDALRPLVQEKIKFAPKPRHRTTRAVEELVRKEEARPEAPDRQAAPSTVVPPEPKSPFYADAGEWRMWRSPRLFRLLQRWRRSLARVPGRIRQGFARFAGGVRRKSPPLFRLGQMTAWSLRAAWRHKLAALLLAATCAALVALPFYYEPGWGVRFGLWAAAALLVAAGAAAAILREAFRRLIGAQEAILDMATRSARQQSAGRIPELEKQLARQKAEFDEARRAIEAGDEALRGMLEMQNKFSNYGNAAVLRTHDRQLSSADVKHIRENWLRLLG